jgi:hypothetical protein
MLFFALSFVKVIHGNLSSDSFFEKFSSMIIWLEICLTLFVAQSGVSVYSTLYCKMVLPSSISTVLHQASSFREKSVRGSAWSV